jgi:hypothetical protein
MLVEWVTDQGQILYTYHTVRYFTEGMLNIAEILATVHTRNITHQDNWGPCIHAVYPVYTTQHTNVGQDTQVQMEMAKLT